MTSPRLAPRPKKRTPISTSQRIGWLQAKKIASVFDVKYNEYESASDEKLKNWKIYWKHYLKSKGNDRHLKDLVKVKFIWQWKAASF